MSRTFIAGYDGSDAAGAAVRFAAALAEPEHADVVAVATFRAAPHVIGKGAAPHVEQQMNLDARNERRELLAALDVPGVDRLVIAADSPSRGLHEAAEAKRAAMIVVGRTRRGWMGRAVQGSTAERLVHGATCPVAAVPMEWSGRVGTVGVAYDPTDEGNAALGYAIDLARRLGSRLLLVSVFEPVLTSYGSAPIPAYDELNTSLKGRRAEALREAAERVPEQLAPDTRLLDGDPGRALAERVPGADVLVVGSRGYGPRHAVLAGSTSRYVLDHAPCPVIVVPRGAVDAEAAADGRVEATA